MKRDIYKHLLDWKSNPERKPLILEGARQVGKTYILKEFGQQEFSSMVYINCHNNPFMAQLFLQDFDMQRIIRGLSAYSGKNIVVGETLVFLDEVQDAPKCIESLKYFCEDVRELHVAVAGSLLGIIDHEGESFPVGKVNTLTMYPMSFEEFLVAKGEDLKKDIITSLEWPNITALSQTLEDLLRQYYYVGGMPEVVKGYIENGDLTKVRRKQQQILKDYDHDFSKHAASEAPKIRLIWNSLPAQLARENKKFIYGAVKKGARARDYENAIQWLIDAGLVYKVTRCTTPSMPLSMYEDQNAFKLFVLDVGLLGAMSKMPAKYMLINNNVFAESKGAFTEDYVLQQLKNRSPYEALGVYYYSKDTSALEVDFVVQTDERVVPLEVKAEENVKSKSLRSFITAEFHEKQLKGLRCSMKDYIDQEWMENIPLYTVGGYFSNYLSSGK